MCEVSLFKDVFKLVGTLYIDDPSGVWMTSVCLYVQSSLSFLHLIMEERIDCVFLNAFMHWAENIRPDVSRFSIVAFGRKLSNNLVRFFLKYRYPDLENIPIPGQSKQLSCMRSL